MNSARIGSVSPLDYAGTEALNTVCSNLSFAGRDLKKIVMTSCDAGEGKSYLTLQIALNLAKRGKRVVLVDADLRRSFIIKKYNIKTEGEWTGLAHYLAGYNRLDEVVYRTNRYDLCLVPVGRHVANPIPLINTPEFSKMLNALADKFDVVLVDAPPVGLVIDAAEIAQYCDGYILVAEYGKTRRRAMMTAKKQMSQSGCSLLGCILNKVSYDTLSAKKYYNRNYYTHYTRYGEAASKKSR